MILDGGGDSDRIRGRIEALERHKQAADAYARQKLSERQANLGWPIALVRVGGETAQACRDGWYAWESGLSSYANAVSGGCVPGGGATLLAIRGEVRACGSATPGESAGVEALISALARPTAVLAENVGRNGEETLRAIEETGAHDMGGDALSGKVQHMKEAGILDATTMLTASIRLASLFTKEFLETGSWDVSR